MKRILTLPFDALERVRFGTCQELRVCLYLPRAEYERLMACDAACAGKPDDDLKGTIYTEAEAVDAIRIALAEITVALAKAEQQRDAAMADAERYRWLRSRDLDTIDKGGVFAGMTPENIVLADTDLDDAIDAAMAKAGAA